MLVAIPMQRIPSIRDIAVKAGFSKSTVALALLNSPLCSRSTKDIVLRTARELGYRPNPLVAANMALMRLRRSHGKRRATLGYLSDINKDYLLNHQSGLRDCYLGARRRAEELGFGLEVFCYGADGLSGQRIRAVLYHRGISGFLVGPHSQPQASLAADCDNLAAVCLGFSIVSPHLDRVGYDQFQNLRDLCERIVERGYRRIGIALTSDFDRRGMHLTLASFLTWDGNRTVQTIPPYVADNFTPKLVLAWLRRYRPDCIITYSSEMLYLLETAGINVPEDVGIAVPSIAWGGGLVSGFSFPIEKLGAAGVDFLVGKLYRNERGVPQNRQTVLIRGDWVEGRTLRQIPLKAAAP